MRPIWHSVFFILALCGHLGAQVVLDLTGYVLRPSGNWADTVLVAFDTREPIGALIRSDAMGASHVVHVVHREHPSQALKDLLGPGLVDPRLADILLLKVNRLRVEEEGTHTVCSMHAEVIKRTGETYWRVHEACISVKGTRCGVTPTCHEDNIRQALQAFLNGFQREMEKGTTLPVALAISDLGTSFSIDTTNTPVLGKEVPRRGLYRSFTQFRQDEPDTLYSFNLRETRNSLSNKHIVKLDDIPGAIVDSCWGMSDGKHPYIRLGKSFIRLDRGGRSYVAVIPQPDTQDPAALLLGGILFGLVGAAIAAGTTTTPNPPVTCDLDMLIGDLVPPIRSVEDRHYARNIFYVTRFARAEDTVTIHSQASSAVTLEKGQWTTLQQPPRAAPLVVSVMTANAEEYVDVDTNSDNTNVYLVDIKKDGSLRISELNEQMKEALLRDLKEEDRR